MTTRHDPLDELRANPPVSIADVRDRWERRARAHTATAVVPAPRRPARTPALAAAGVTAAVTTGLVLLPATPPPALAGWTPEPGPVTAAQRAAIETFCMGGWDAMPSRSSDLAMTEEPGPAGAPSAGSTPSAVPFNPVRELALDAGPADLIDRRGNAAVAVWYEVHGDQRTHLTCQAADTDGDGRYDVGGQGGGSGDAMVGPRSFGGDTSTSPNHRIETWQGVVGPDVARVVVERRDGVEVEASLDDQSFFVAWWPGGSSATTSAARIVTFDRDGTVIDRWANPSER